MELSAPRARRGSTGVSSGQRAGGFVLGAVAVGLLFAAPTALAAPEGEAYVLTDVQCDANHNGVLDLTLINERSSAEAVFVVTDARTATSSEFTVAPQSAAAVTFTDLSDGLVAVPVAVDGVPTSVAVSVVCDPPEVAVMPTSVRKPSGQSALPVTGSSSGGLITGAALVAAGMAVSLIARRRYS
ncbi:MAG: hypothetical protein Q8M22_06195 [Actinomycetota bacterium]|nr:hypothetical protein [Actinomycetota bacterium]